VCGKAAKSTFLTRGTDVHGVLQLGCSRRRAKRVKHCQGRDTHFELLLVLLQMAGVNATWKVSESWQKSTWPSAMPASPRCLPRRMTRTWSEPIWWMAVGMKPKTNPLRRTWALCDWGTQCVKGSAGPYMDASEKWNVCWRWCLPLQHHSLANPGYAFLAPPTHMHRSLASFTRERCDRRLSTNIQQCWGCQIQANNTHSITAHIKAAPGTLGCCKNTAMAHHPHSSGNGLILAWPGVQIADQSDSRAIPIPYNQQGNC